jgi:hypothetical protein
VAQEAATILVVDDEEDIELPPSFAKATEGRRPPKLRPAFAAEARCRPVLGAGSEGGMPPLQERSEDIPGFVDCSTSMD